MREAILNGLKKHERSSRSGKIYVEHYIGIVNLIFTQEKNVKSVCVCVFHSFGSENNSSYLNSCSNLNLSFLNIKVHCGLSQTLCVLNNFTSYNYVTIFPLKFSAFFSVFLTFHFKNVNSNICPLSQDGFVYTYDKVEET